MSACGVGQWGKRACAWRKGWWQRWGIVYIQEVCKIKLITKMIGEWFLLLEKGGTNIERKKTKTKSTGTSVSLGPLILSEVVVGSGSR